MELTYVNFFKDLSIFSISWLINKDLNIQIKNRTLGDNLIIYKMIFHNQYVKSKYYIYGKFFVDNKIFKYKEPLFLVLSV